MVRTVLGAAVVAAAFLPVQASAETKDQVTLYSRGNFTGSRYTITGPTQGIQVPFTVRSVAIPEGTQWELCSGNKFTGCRQLNESLKGAVISVRSARPVAPPLPATAAALTAVPGQPGPSLRGLASEYFVAPDMGGNRVEVRAGTAEAASAAADEFCLARGWRSSGHERLQQLASTFYLADVLCIQTAR